MSHYYLNAEQTGLRDVMPRPFHRDEPDPSWLDHSHLSWERQLGPVSYRRGRSIVSDYPQDDLQGVDRAMPGHRHARFKPYPQRAYAPEDWPGQALMEFFGDAVRGRRLVARRHGAGAPDNRGRGPKGWKRSDDRIVEEICERLSDDPFIDARDISVSCRDGVVELQGRVDERAIKHRVEDIVDDCVGVERIDNRLQVDRNVAGDPAERLLR